jgi:LmbE family N-acetylglucosaminyl deacetylase
MSDPRTPPHPDAARREEPDPATVGGPVAEATPARPEPPDERGDQARPPVLLAVRAHPDDEVIATGGTLAKYGAAGWETVVVTCTDGAQGDGPGGVKPGEPGHEPAAVVATRHAELVRSCAELGVTHLELLGYGDSGMVGWSANDDPSAFANAPIDEAAERLAAILGRYRPTVVLTDDANGGYGHPDHVQTHRVTVAALERAALPASLYFAAIPRRRMRDLFVAAAAAGLDVAALGFDPDAPPDPDFGTDDDRLTTVIDVRDFVAQKRRALEAHGSQVDDSFFLRIPEEIFTLAFGEEFFVRSGAAVPERLETALGVAPAG